MSYSISYRQSATGQSVITAWYGAEKIGQAIRANCTGRWVTTSDAWFGYRFFESDWQAVEWMVESWQQWLAAIEHTEPSLCQIFLPA